ncbi:hypothetical protein EYF80_059105 [Liparis tanakae]|uniref:Uncharacterized protein n=1 Tax=Liparis tanakae TaxID=230148 RepID=A0A4Z2EQV0_9TELE|nr:hypothetical protein EYF80_059105 [Liparis tanakae]
MRKPLPQRCPPYMFLVLGGLERHFPPPELRTYPVAAAMMQPPSSALARQQPAASWLMPKLWPISWAMVAATPTADSEWS